MTTPRAAWRNPPLPVVLQAGEQRYTLTPGEAASLRGAVASSMKSAERRLELEATPDIREREIRRLANLGVVLALLDGQPPPAPVPRERRRRARGGRKHRERMERQGHAAPAPRAATLAASLWNEDGEPTSPAGDAG